MFNPSSLYTLLMMIKYPEEFSGAHVVAGQALQANPRPDTAQQLATVYKDFIVDTAKDLDQVSAEKKIKTFLASVVGETSVFPDLVNAVLFGFTQAALEIRNTNPPLSRSLITFMENIIDQQRHHLPIATL